jgi:hypothetical protein
MTTTPDASTCCQSSPELKADVANFLDRAEAIASNPLAGQDATFKVQMQMDLRTREVGPTGFDPDLLPEDDWLSMAVRMRPIIFTENDPVSIPRLTSQIEAKHEQLRGRLKQARKGLADWKKHAFVYAGNLGGGVQPPMTRAGEIREQYVRIGPPGGSPSSVPTEGLTRDYVYAHTYMNSLGWHSDTDKSMEYQAASPHMRLHYRKCAEIRVLSAAKDIIPPLRQWILDARAAGHDL